MPRPPSPVEVDNVVLAVIREKNGDTKTSLAERAGLSLSYYADLESGRRKGNPDVIAKLAAALNIPKSVIEKRRPERAA